MGQVVFKAPSKGWEVIGGYDSVGKEFFLYVFNLRPVTAAADSVVVWSNLVDFNPVDRTSTLRLRTRLKVMGVEAPEGFWSLVERQEDSEVRHEWMGGAWVSNKARVTLTPGPVD